MKNIDCKTYTVVEAAEQIGASRFTVRRWIKSGKLPFVRVGKCLFIPRQAFDALLAGEIVNTEKANQ
jgi:excisionase family DNA binding protein